MGSETDSQGRLGELTRRDFLATVGAGTLAWLAGRFLAFPTAEEERPAIIVIVADDLGYADLGVQGCQDIPTPNLDSLATGGVRFTNAYVSCPVCSPTRAGLLTGRYQQRFGHEFNPGRLGPGTAGFGLPLSETTLADVLKAAGYATGLVGKWHLGEAPDYHPLKRGFQEFFGFLGGASSYLTPRALLRGTEPVTESEYLTDAFAREAVAFIERHQAHPFFLYLAFNAVHAPLEASDKYLQRFPNLTDQKRRVYAAMLSALDEGVGAVLSKLQQVGRYENTLIFFLSDNGGPVGKNGASNGPLRAGKGTVYEGGVRVPFFMHWPRRLRGGQVYEQPVISLDIFPTAAAAAGAQLPEGRALDGVNLLPYLLGEKAGPPHEILFWRYGTAHAVRKGNWKLVRRGDQPAELYDLANDVSESRDLAAQHPEVVRELSEALERWESELAEPLWKPVPKAARRRAAPPQQRQRLPGERRQRLPGEGRRQRGGRPGLAP
jgi:arylsulfatase A-like enzyme